LIRPENLVISASSNAQDGNARVEQIVYLGYDQLLQLGIKDHDKPLVARIRSVERFAVGQSVHVRIVEPTIAFPKNID
jgi:ABC-type sugar transport system ATPase subunit